MKSFKQLSHLPNLQPFLSVRPYLSWDQGSHSNHPLKLAASDRLRTAPTDDTKKPSPQWYWFSQRRLLLEEKEDYLPSIWMCTYGHVIAWAVTSDCPHTGTPLHGDYDGKCYAYPTSSPRPHRAWLVVFREAISFKSGWLWGNNLYNARQGFVRVDVDVWAGFEVRFDDVIPVSMVCNTGVFGLWVVGFGVEVSATELGMGNRIVVVSSFLRNRRFRKVILPCLSTLTRY